MLRLDIQSVLILNNKNKNVRNKENNIYLINIKNNLIQDKINTQDNILSTNLIQEENKEIIFICFN